jgi:hypothetical protein
LAGLVDAADFRPGVLLARFASQQTAEVAVAGISDAATGGSTTITWMKVPCGGEMPDGIERKGSLLRWCCR